MVLKTNNEQLKKILTIMKARNLSYNVTKYYVENEIIYKMNVRISLGDCCKDGVCDWSITADNNYENVEFYEKEVKGK